MNEFDWYLAELMRIRRSIQVYIELFCCPDAVQVLDDVSPKVFSIFQRSLHDEIVASLSTAFDSAETKLRGRSIENLSLYNLFERHEALSCSNINSLKKEVDELLTSLDLKTFRNKRSAHNDKKTILDRDVIKHGIESNNLLDLIQKTIDLILELKARQSNAESVSVPVNTNDRFTGEGTVLVEKLKQL